MNDGVLVVAVALIEREGRYFLQRRDPRSRRFANLWEFPGGKLEAGETAEQALVRELMEELRWSPAIMEPLPVLEYVYPDLKVAIHPFRCRGEGLLHTDLPWGWFPSESIGHLNMPDATKALAESLSPTQNLLSDLRQSYSGGDSR